MKITAIDLLALIEQLPDSDKHIYTDNDKYCVTNEWLCGSFAGRGFDGDSIEEATNKLIDYLYLHIGHNSMVGKCVTDSGFPNLDMELVHCKQNIL